MHAIASMVRALRNRPSAYGFVGANGGFLSKYSVGIYSTTPAAWTGFDSHGLQAEIDAWPSPLLAPQTSGEGTIETYTIDYAGKAPRGLALGQLDVGGRFIAMTDPQDTAVVQAMIAQDPLGRRVVLDANEQGQSIIRSFVAR